MFTVHSVHNKSLSLILQGKSQRPGRWPGKPAGGNRRPEDTLLNYHGLMDYKTYLRASCAPRSGKLGRGFSRRGDAYPELCGRCGQAMALGAKSCVDSISSAIFP